MVTVISCSLWIALLVYAATNGKVFLADCEVLFTLEICF